MTIKTITFNEQWYMNFLTREQSQPPRAFAPFINVNREIFGKLLDKSRPLDLEPLKARLGEKEMSTARGAVSLTLKHSYNFFPAYRLLANEFLNDEWLAMVDWHKEFHRDHVTHQSMTAAIGMCLLNGGKVNGDEDNKINFGGKTLLEHCVEAVLNQENYLTDYAVNMGVKKTFFDDNEKNRFIWSQLILDTFFVAALFHDLGYPYRFVNQIHRQLDRLRPSDATEEDPVERGTDWIADHYRDRLLFYPLNGYRKTAPGDPIIWREKFRKLVHETMTGTHGAPGAVSFLHLNDIMREFPHKAADPRRQFCLEWAAMAILMHDMARIYADVDDGPPLMLKVKNPQLRLRFPTDPLSCVLTLCDNIQDFARPDAVFRRPPDRKPPDKKDDGPECDSAISYHRRCKGVRLDWDEKNGELGLTYLCADGPHTKKKRLLFIPGEQLRIFEPDEGFLDLKSIGVGKIILHAAG